MSGEYAHPETLVDVKWVQENLGTPNVRLVEVDVDPSLYAQGHIEGAVGWNWETDLCDPLRRDVIGREDFEKLCSAAGHRGRHHGRPVWRLQQLVRMLGIVGVQALRASGRATDERRADEVGEGRSSVRDGRRGARSGDLSGGEGRSGSARVSPGGRGASRPSTKSTSWTCDPPTSSPARSSPLRG